jgi:hypothetical protein
MDELVVSRDPAAMANGLQALATELIAVLDAAGQTTGPTR